MDHLALVHLTNSRPLNSSEGMIVESAFRRSGGFNQSQEDRLRLRQTLHYSLQSAVTDHAYGSFEGRQWAVVAPLREALNSNGRPESLLASDVAFFPQNGQMVLPGAVLIEFTNDLDESLFIEPNPSGLRVATALTPANKTQALEYFEQLSHQGQDLNGVLSQLKDANKTWSTAELTELGISAALASLNKPTLQHLKGISPGSPMGFDGWLTSSEVDQLALEIENQYADEGMGPIHRARHDGTAGDQLFTALSRLNKDVLSELKQTAPPRVLAEIQNWEQSDFFNQLRSHAILKEIMDGPGKVVLDSGRETPGLVGSLFGFRASGQYESLRLGSISLPEVQAVISNLSEQQHAALLKRLSERSDNAQEMGSAYRHMLHALSPATSQPPPPPPTGFASQTPPPPPAVASPIAPSSFSQDRLTAYRQLKAPQHADASPGNQMRSRLSVG